MSLLKRSAALIVALAGLAVVAAPPGDALARGRAKGAERHVLSRPARAPDADAEGVVKVERGKKGDRMVVKLSNLDAESVYEVRDADTGAVLGSVRTNKKGKAKLRLRSGVASAKKVGDVATDVNGVAVYRDGDEAFCLVGSVARDGKGDPGFRSDARFGDAFYGSMQGPNANVSLFTDGDGYDSFFASLWVSTGSGAHGYELYLDNVGGGTLPLGAESVVDLAGRAFDIVDAGGEEVVAGDLPELQSVEDLWNGEFDMLPPDVRGASDERTFTAPFTLRIADGEGALTDAGTFEETDYGVPGDFRSGFLFFGTYDGANGSMSLFSDDLGESFSVSLWMPSADGGGGTDPARGSANSPDGTTSANCPVGGGFGGTYLEYSASRYGGEGALPLGVDALDDLAGRAFELRNGSGRAFATGVVPALASDAWGVEWDGQDQGEAITPGAGPYTLFIADGEGTLREVGELTEPDWGDPYPVDYRWSETTFGSYSGANGGLYLTESTDYAYLSASLYVPTGGRNSWDGSYYELSIVRNGADGALPLGVDSLEELAGRAFELRNGGGTAFVRGTVPEFTDGGFAEPLYWDGSDLPAITPGDAPYSLWMGDGGGTLVRVGQLEELVFEIYPPGVPGTR